MSRLTGADRLHFVPIPYPGQLFADYLPAALAHEDYPDLIASGETVDTVAVGAVLVCYNWPKTSADRYRRVQVGGVVVSEDRRVPAATSEMARR